MIGQKQPEAGMLIGMIIFFASLRPSLRWEPTYDWRLEVGGLYFWADSYNCGPFGPVKDDDQIYGVIEWRF